MASDDRRDAAASLATTADRLDELADVAELMGDEQTAIALRTRSERCRTSAMVLLD